MTTDKRADFGIERYERRVMFVVPRVTDEEVTVAVVSAIVHSKNMYKPDFKETLRKAITDWVLSEQEGRRAWKGAANEFNIGDLVEFQECLSLQTALSRHGIRRLQISVYSDISSEADWYFDDVLVDGDKLEEPT